MIYVIIRKEFDENEKLKTCGLQTTGLMKFPFFVQVSPSTVHFVKKGKSRTISKLLTVVYLDYEHIVPQTNIFLNKNVFSGYKFINLKPFLTVTCVGVKMGFFYICKGSVKDGFTKRLRFELSYS